MDRRSAGSHDAFADGRIELQAEMDAECSRCTAAEAASLDSDHFLK